MLSLTPGTLPATIIGAIAAFVGAAFILHGVYYIGRRSRDKNALPGILEAAAMTVGMLYLIGMGAKLTLIGPDFVRFYVGDIGFPVMTGYVLGHLASSWTVWRHIHDEHAANDARFKRQMVTLGIALVLSYGYELLVGWAYTSISGTETALVGSFDPIDMLMYTIGAGAAALCYIFSWKESRKQIDEYLAAVAEARLKQAAEQAHRTAATKTKKKRHTPPRVNRRRKKG